VLARLQERADVDAAEVDRRGELLRVRLREGGTVTAITDQLEQMGFLAEEAVIDAGPLRWYGPSAVGELSREESRVVAARVVPVFGAAHALSPSDVEAASALVADALYACFVRRYLTDASASGLAGPCGAAVEQATRERLGAEAGAALGRAIEADLSGASTA